MPGSLCISIDVELAWGIWDKPNDEVFARCAAREQDIVRALVEMFVRHEISATWAVVGRLLELDEQRAASTRHGAAIWYAPDIIERIRSAPVPQDIGSHSYAHIYYGQNSPEVVREDLIAARRAHEQHGLSFRSFVFPRNDIAHVPLLHDAGLSVYRDLDVGWHVDARRLGRMAGRVAHLVDQIVPVTPAVVTERHDAEVSTLAGSMLFMSRNGFRRAISPAITIAKARRGLAAASDSDRTFHLWFHPSNFYFDTRRQLETLEEILKTAAIMRRSRGLTVRPMSAYASVAS